MPDGFAIPLDDFGKGAVSDEMPHRQDQREQHACAESDEIQNPFDRAVKGIEFISNIQDDPEQGVNAGRPQPEEEHRLQQ